MAQQPRRNTTVALVVTGVVGGMVGLSFASVPLYRLFCQVTGYGGTTQRADAAPGAASDDARIITVRFDSNVANGLNWAFAPEQREVKVRLGEDALAFFMAHNNSDAPVVGQATFNVTPTKAAPYFVKTACFCFNEQTLQPGQQVSMPVSFYVDPELMKDRNTLDVTTITLSYTFFPAVDAAPPAGSTAKSEKPSG